MLKNLNFDIYRKALSSIGVEEGCNFINSLPHALLESAKFTWGDDYLNKVFSIEKDSLKIRIPLSDDFSSQPFNEWCKEVGLTCLIKSDYIGNNTFDYYLEIPFGLIAASKFPGIFDGENIKTAEVLNVFRDLINKLICSFPGGVLNGAIGEAETVMPSLKDHGFGRNAP